MLKWGGSALGVFGEVRVVAGNFLWQPPICYLSVSEGASVLKRSC